jgi:hypothetical protein
VRSPQSTGAFTGESVGFGLAGDEPLDQRLDDGGSLTFETKPLTRDVEALGLPQVILNVSCDRPNGLVAVRLCEVLPDGASTLVAWGTLNLTRRRGLDRCDLLTPGKRYRVTVPLHGMAHRFGRGNRIRISISNALWPMVWPSPEPNTLSLHTAGSHITLPIRKPPRSDRSVPQFPEAAITGSVLDDTPVTTLLEGGTKRTTSRDTITGIVHHRLLIDGIFGPVGRIRIEDANLEMAHTYDKQLWIHDTDPNSARMEMTQRFEFGRDGWRIRVESKSEMRSTIEQFQLAASMDVYEGDARVFTRSWNSTHARLGI